MNFKQFLQFTILIIFSTIKVWAKSNTPSQILVVTLDDDSEELNYAFNSVADTMKEYSIKFDRLPIKKVGIYDSDIDNALYLNENGMILPRYRVIVFPNGRVSYNHNDYSKSEYGDWQSAITQSQWDKFYDCSRNYNTRLVFLNEYPSNYTGTSLYREYLGAEAEAKYKTKQVVIAEKGVIEDEAINSSNLTTEEIYHFPAKLENIQGIVSDPFLYFSENEDFPEPTIAAVTVDNNGAKYAAFFMAFGNWSKTSTALNFVWLSWALESDLKYISSQQIETAQAIKETSGSPSNINLKIIVTVSLTIFAIVYNLL